MAGHNSSNFQDKSLDEIHDLKRLKLLIQASNKQRLQSCLKEQNFSNLDENSEIIEPSVFKKDTASEGNMKEEKTFKSSNELQASDQISCSQNVVKSNSQTSPLKTNFTESPNDVDLFISDCSQSNLDDLLNMSDSDDLLCSISMNKEESFDDDDEDETFIKFSTELQDSDLKCLVFDNLSLWEKQKVPALQIGSGIPPPILTVEEAAFSSHTLRVLKEINFFGPSCIQSVVWPSISRGRNMVVIAPPHSGKTVSYVLPLVSGFTSEAISKETKEKIVYKNLGPRLIVLCSTWVKALAVRNYFNLFLDSFKMKIITICTEGGKYKNKMQFLINNCDILIGTPYCFLKFLREKTITLTRLEYFILDDGSDIMGKHKKELKEIFVRILEIVNKAESCPQFMICAERWNKNFQIIIDKLMQSPLLYFTSFLEAAVYAKIPISVHISSTEGEKKMSLLSMVKNAGRVVICMTDLSDALEVHQFLKRFCYKSYVVNENMEHYVMDDIIKKWKSDLVENALCLVTTDQCLTKMCISNAHCLIHYDIPPESRLQFGNRLSYIADHLHLIQNESAHKCVCHVLLMESEHYFAPHLVEILENIGKTPSEKLLELSKIQIEEKKDSGDLCHYMKAFGLCKKQNCQYRHAVDPAIDKPQVVPCQGDLHGIVTYIIDASHFNVRLIKYLDPVSNDTVSLSGAYAKVGFQLRDFYIKASEEIKVEAPVVGECYVLGEETKVFYRIKVLDYIPESSSKLAQWKILYLDEGWIKYYEKPTLYKLSDQIELPEPLAVEVYLCNVMTPDSCFDWNPQTSYLISDLILGKEVHGKIVLCIGKALWLDPLAVAVKLPAGYYAYPFKVNQKLYDYGHARQNKKHLPLLYKACDNKIKLPHIIKPTHTDEKIEEEEPSKTYAYVECNDYEDVYVSSVVSPNQLYIQRAKFVECLDDLLDKINLQVEKRKLNKVSTVCKDMICVAPFHEDNRYYRAAVTEIVSYDEIQVFFVDFGDTGKVSRKDIFCLPAEFMLLPFQAIECELAGIAAPHGGWSESAVNILNSLTRDEAHDMKILQLKAYSKTSSYAGGNHYVIDLWDDGKKISEKLLEAGFGVATDFVEPSSIVNNSSTQPNSEIFSFDDEYSSSSDDEELDPEDKMIAAQFYGFLAKMMAEEYNLYPKPATITEVSSDEEEILKKSTSNAPPFTEKCKDLQNLIPKLTPSKINESSSSASNSIVKPLITWWDTPEELNILIMLKDIKLYQLDVTDERLNFSAIIAGVQYSTEEKFYENINSNEANTHQSIQGINIVAKKHTPFKWPRFTKEKKKFFHIKYDLIHLDDSDNDEEPVKDLESERLRYLYGDENSSSTDEEEKYVEPWSEFAQTKDVYSQLS